MFARVHGVVDQANQSEGVYMLSTPETICTSADIGWMDVWHVLYWVHQQGKTYCSLTLGPGEATLKRQEHAQATL